MSFQYSGVSEDVQSLSAELEALGGGNARVATGMTYALVHKSEGDVVESLYAEGNAIVAVDPKQSKDPTCFQNKRRFDVAGVIFGREQGALLAGKIVDCLTSGFNATLLAYGQAGTGKTNLLFGSERTLDSSSSPPCLSEAITMGLLRTMGHEVKSGITSLGISCWELRDNVVYDLLAVSPMRISLVIA